LYGYIRFLAEDLGFFRTVNIRKFDFDYFPEPFATVLVAFNKYKVVEGWEFLRATLTDPSKKSRDSSTDIPGKVF
jgi:hypothetical protein